MARIQMETALPFRMSFNAGVVSQNRYDEVDLLARSGDGTIEWEATVRRGDIELDGSQDILDHGQTVRVELLPLGTRRED